MTFTLTQITLITVAAAMLLAVFFKLGSMLGSARADQKWHMQMKKIRKDIADSSRSIIRGQVSEQMAPYLPGFPFDPASCKFLGSPVDFVVFHKLDDPSQRAVVLVEVKTGSAGLNENEKLVKEAINAGRVYYYEYRFDGVKKPVTAASAK